MANVVEVIFRGVDQISRNTSQINSSLTTMRRTALRAAAGLTAAFGGVALVREIGRSADTMTLLENRLRLVTDSTEELNTVQADLFRLAQDTRSALAPTVNLYARVARSVEDLGIAERSVLDLTRTVNQAIQISGATAQESSAGVIQFAQALASGELRGEELRSVMEQMPRLSRAIADGLETIGFSANVTIGDLRKLAEAGELSADLIIKALLSQAPKIGEEFEQLTPTIASAFQVLQNSLTEMVGDISDATGASDGLANSLISVADAVTDLSNIIDPSDVTRAEQITNELEELQDPTLFDSLKISLRSIGDVVESIRNPSAMHTAANTLGMGRIQELEAELAAIEARAERMRGLSPIIISDPDRSSIDEFFADWEADNKAAIARLADSLIREFEPIEDKIARELREVDLAAHLIPDDLEARIRERIKAQRLEGLAPIIVDDIEAMDRRLAELLDHTDETFDQLQAIADEAARSMQRAFSDFFFDPFQDGLEGMVTGFLNAIRRMLADEAAVRFFNLLSGKGTSGGGILGGIFKAIGGLFGGGGNPFSTAPPGGGPPRAHGGFTIPGLLHPVNEREPEFLLTRGRSEVVPLSKMAASGKGGNGIVYSPRTELNLLSQPLTPEQIDNLLETREALMFAKFKRMLRDDGID